MQNPDSCDFSAWADTLDAHLRARPCFVKRAVVSPELVSTQDTAREIAGNQPGLLVVADHQTAARGRLGRPWVQRPGLVLAATFTFSIAQLAPERLSLIAGLAAARAIESTLAQLLPDPLLTSMRWPNDVLEPRSDGGRKLAGVLIEVRAGIALVGIGINILHKPEDFPPHLRTRATSVRAVAASRGATALPDRFATLLALIDSLSRGLIEPLAETTAEWSRRDILPGTHRTFVHDGRAVKGHVLAIDPLNLITIRTDAGERVQLPALTTSLVHDA